MTKINSDRPRSLYLTPHLSWSNEPRYFRKPKTQKRSTNQSSNNKHFFKIGFYLFFLKIENSAPLSVIAPGLGEGENELGVTIFFSLALLF